MNVASLLPEPRGPVVINYDRLEIVIDWFLYITVGVLVASIMFFGYVHSLPQNKYNPIVHYHDILSKDVCDKTIQLAEIYAKEHSWTTQRHRNYPTTDLPVYILQEANITVSDLEGITDSYQYIEWLNNTIETKVFPLIRQHFDLLPEDQVKLKDFFIVKYDADHPESQSHLDIHLDSSTISFNIALNDHRSTSDTVEATTEERSRTSSKEEDMTELDTIAHTTYMGGGTRFLLSPRAIMNPKGSIVLHPSKLYHEGMKITSGKRYILVGFVNAFPANYMTRNFFRHFGRFSSCLNISYHTAQGDLLEQEPMICRSVLYSYAYELYHLFKIYVFYPKKEGLSRYVNQVALICLALAIGMAIFALIMVAVEYIRWIIVPLLWKQVTRKKTV